MIQLKKMSIIATLLVSTSVLAEDGVYVSLGAGISKFKSVRSSEMPILYKSPSWIRMPEFGDDVDTLKFKNSFKLSAAIGYRYENFRIEVEPFYSRFKYNGFYFNGKPILNNDGFSGHTKLSAIFLNAHYNLCLNSVFTPYLGMGLGYIKVINQLKQSNLNQYVGAIWTVLPPVQFKTKDNSAAYQAIIGTMFNLNKKTSFSIDYRFLKSMKKLKSFDSKITNHSINLGVVYQF